MGWAASPGLGRCAALTHFDWVPLGRTGCAEILLGRKTARGDGADGTCWGWGLVLEGAMGGGFLGLVSEIRLGGDDWPRGGWGGCEGPAC